jgi:phosphatidylinositol alpha-1,6-mannosyltransferase
LDAFDPTARGPAVRARHDLGADPVVVCVGRLVPRKGQDRLVDAWPSVRRRIPAARLVIVGDGPQRKALARAATRQPAGAVTLAGRVPGPALADYLAAADLFAHPNRSRWFGLETEGFGVVFLEAQAAGRAVVAGNSGGSPEAILDGHTGMLVDGRDVDAIADTVVALLSDPDRRAAMGAAGRAFVERTYDWDVIVADLAEQLRATAAGHPPPTTF